MKNDIKLMWLFLLAPLVVVIYGVVSSMVGPRNGALSKVVDEQPFKVEIRREESFIQKLPHQSSTAVAGGKLLFIGKITNTSDSPRTIRVSCNGCGWITDHKDLSVGCMCMNDEPQDRTLLPHENYEEQLTVILSSEVKTGMTSLKLGFMPSRVAGIKDSSDTTKSVIWSDVINVDVVNRIGAN